MFQFILGALAGGVAAWWWRNDIQRYIEQTLPNVRAKAHDQLEGFYPAVAQLIGAAVACAAIRFLWPQLADATEGVVVPREREVGVG